MCFKYSRIQQVLLLIIVTMVILVGACSSGPTPEKNFANPPRSQMPLTEELEPGLAVLYFYGSMTHLYFMEKGEIAKKAGKPGPPVMSLDHKVDEGQEILQSGMSAGVAAELTGFIKFEKAGQYLFQANSNDGIRVFIDGKLLIDDPEFHADRLSEEATFEVSSPGWYWIGIRYFQKGHAATLQLFWKTPGAEEFEIVPGSVLGHIGNA